MCKMCFLYIWPQQLPIFFLAVFKVQFYLGNVNCLKLMNAIGYFYLLVTARGTILYLNLFLYPAQILFVCVCVCLFHCYLLENKQ